MIKEIAKKSVIRLSINIKRKLCKYCHLILIPGISCRIRQKRKNKANCQPYSRCSIVCLGCGYQKLYISDPNYSLWPLTAQSTE
ncbi:unnamed protein product [Gordionus sp. m RMFG-2023]